MTKYKPLPQTVEITEEKILLQAISTLDVAAEVAEKLNDVEGLLNVAAMWMKLSENVGNYQSQTPGHALQSEEFITSLPTGFQRTEITIGEQNDRD